MKTKRRHELETNQLADWLGTVMDRLRPRANLILTAAVVVLVALLAVNFLMRRSRSRARAAWTALATARTPSELAAVNDDYPGSPAGKWAMLRSADLELATGMQRLLRNREQALVNLRTAQRTYERLAGNSPESPLVDERACIGLAKSLEALGEVDRAVEAYQEVLNRFPQGLFASEAKQRIEDLKDPQVAEFYAWLAKQEGETTSDLGPTPPASTGQMPATDLGQQLDPLAPTLPLTTPDLDASDRPEPAETPAETEPASGEKDPAANPEPTNESSEPAKDDEASDKPANSPIGAEPAAEPSAKPADQTPERAPEKVPPTRDQDPS